MFPDLTGNLSSVMNLVPVPDKMTIIPLKKSSPIPLPNGLPYVVMFNPENFSETFNIVYNQEQPIGSVSREQKFHRQAPRTFTFEFLIDGTGASGDKREVIAEIELFKKTVEFKGDQHRPSYLLLVWGVHVVTAVLVNLQIRYTLFRKNGTPLRAVLTATFREHTERVLQVLKQALQSPDLTTRRTVQTGDKLPLLSYKVYDTPRHYLEVARANGLTNFRKLRAGTELDFPPVAKTNGTTVNNS